MFHVYTAMKYIRCRICMVYARCHNTKVGVLTYFLPKTAWKSKNLDPPSPPHPPVGASGARRWSNNGHDQYTLFVYLNDILHAKYTAKFYNK